MEFIDLIRPYYPGIKVKTFEIFEIEQALFDVFIKLIGRILYFSPENMKKFLQDYLLKFEITNIKQVVLGTITGMSMKEKSKRINFQVEEYLNHEDFISDLLEMPSLDEIQLYMSKTRYNKPIREGILYFKKTGEIFVLEAFLDQLYYLNLLERSSVFDKKESEMISLFISSLVENYNLKVISRGIINKIDKQLLGQFIINSFLFLDSDKLYTLLNLTDINKFYEFVEFFLKKAVKKTNVLIPVNINKKHLMWSLAGIYQNYYFDHFKLKIDDIEYSTIYRILELIIKKDKEIKFDIMPNIIRIVHENAERLEKAYGDF